MACVPAEEDGLKDRNADPNPHQNVYEITLVVDRNKDPGVQIRLQ